MTRPPPVPRPDKAAPATRAVPQRGMGGAPSRRGRLILAGLLALVAGPELVLWLADHGLVGSVRWRLLAYQYGAFWPGLLADWRPNFPLQGWLMFESYALLHAGLVHMAGNLAGLAWLGAAALVRFGAGGLVEIWLVSAAAGGLVYGFLAHAPVPMVGASGAVFGLAGAWIAAEWQDRRAADPATPLCGPARRSSGSASSISPAGSPRPGSWPGRPISAARWPASRSARSCRAGRDWGPERNPTGAKRGSDKLRAKRNS